MTEFLALLANVDFLIGLLTIGTIAAVILIPTITVIQSLFNR